MISQQQYAARRLELMGLMSANSVAILPAARLKTRNRDCDYLFRQDSDFYYLTGFNEAETVLVLVPGRSHGECILFCQESSAEEALWFGEVIGPEAAVAQHGFDDAFPYSDIDDILPGLIEGRSRLYYAMGTHEQFDQRVMSWVNRIKGKQTSGAHPPGEFVSLDHYLHDLRLFKSAGELKLMQKAAEISAAAHKRVMQICKPGMWEYQIEAELNHSFAMAGARFPAYNAIVGGGKNGCVLHYSANDKQLVDGDLLLIDAACEYQNYAADITRTFPVNGKFSPRQADLYDIVLAANVAGINAVRLGNDWNQPHIAAVTTATQGLKDIGVLSGDVSNLVEREAYKPYYMHKTGHWLGLDVHDVGDYQVADQWRQLELGMVLTIEPGLYFPPNEHNQDNPWRGMAVRIEDDVVVSKENPKVLSNGVPKQRLQIEELMADGE